VVTDRLSVVDLLAHRSGLPRHDLAWLGHPGRSRAEMVRRLRFLPLSKDLRQAFQYCNLGYLVAGHLVEVLSGTRWEDYLRTRLLTPLRMDRSQLSADDMLADPDHATGYERREGVVVPVPLRPVTAMAPAGAVNSCAAAMARWLLAQLSGGQVDGQAKPLTRALITPSRAPRSQRSPPGPGNRRPLDARSRSLFTPEPAPRRSSSEPAGPTISPGA
jgi:CubicO group peptidase (beta-lactamase class C family)